MVFLSELQGDLIPKYQDDYLIFMKAGLPQLDRLSLINEQQINIL